MKPRPFWPTRSGVEPVNGGERVTIFALNNPLRDTNYSHVFCNDTFPTNKSIWKALVKRASD